MDDVSDLIKARHEAELGVMEGALNEHGHDTRLLEASDQVPLPTLLVALGADDENRERTLGVSIMPFDEDAFDATDLIQFYVQLPFEVPTDRRADIGAAATEVNAALAVGHFALRGTELYYRYVLATPNNAVVDGDMLTELVSLIAFHQEHFGDYFEGVLEGQIDLSVLPELLAES